MKVGVHGDTPRPRSAELKALVDRLASIFDPVSLRIVGVGAFERQRAEKIAARLTGSRPATLRSLPREELVGRVVAAFFSRGDVAYEVVRELDRATVSERSLVRSIDSPDVGHKLGSLHALRLRRHGAKLVWALARDEREDVWPLARKVMREYIEVAERLDRARAAVREKGAGQELEQLEELYRDTAARAAKLEEEVSVVERERARLIAEIGRREVMLREEAQRRRSLAEELGRARADVRPEVPPPRGEASPSDPDAGKLRKLQKRLSAQDRELEQLRAAAGRAAELEEENARLCGTIASLRELRARERTQGTAPVAMTSDGSTAGPLVGSPHDKRAGGGKRSATPRIGVFLDVANLAGAARRLYDRAVDFRRLLTTVAAGGRLVEARAYAIDKGGGGYEAFATALRQAGYRVLTKKPKSFDDGTVKADWDVGIAVEVLASAAKLDVVVLGSGDGDFMPVVSALKGAGVRVELAAFPERTAAELARAADRFIELGATDLER